MVDARVCRRFGRVAKEKGRAQTEALRLLGANIENKLTFYRLPRQNLARAARRKRPHSHRSPVELAVLCQTRGSTSYIDQPCPACTKRSRRGNEAESR